MHRIVLLLLLVATTGCAVGGTGNPFEGGSGSYRDNADATPTTFQVRAMNPSFMDVTIFAIDAYTRGRRIRVGRLGSSQEQILDFRMTSAMRDVRFQLEYLAGPTCVTGVISLVPGDVVELILPLEPRNEMGCG